MRVLVVDRDQPSIELLTTRLEHLGHEAVVAHSPEEALHLTARSPVDLVFVELCLEHGPASGLSLLFDLRRQAATERVPIFIHSIYISVPKEIASAPLLADGYLPKPFSMSELRDVLMTATRESAVRG